MLSFNKELNHFSVSEGDGKVISIERELFYAILKGVDTFLSMSLIRIHNDLIQSINTQKVSALVLFDLSAAFDTTDHNILLYRLESNFGISDTALSLLSSYLSNRAQSILIENHSSYPSSILTGVPQGFVLGPLLFCFYTSPLGHIFSNCPVSYHLYADDTQF